MDSATPMMHADTRAAGRRKAIDMSTTPALMDFRFTAPIGVEVKGETWSCIEVPGSRELFGTRGGSLKVVASVDGVPLSAGLLPTGTGGHMLSVSAKLRQRIGRQIGDHVTVHITEGLT